jgi:predicted lipoprotein with Yx(FWY)xxD motif
MRIKLLPVVAIAALATAGCGSSSSSAKGDPAPASTRAAAAPTAASAAARGPKVKVVSSDYGRILADGRGRALYLFTADKGKASTCSGDCATAWPPYIVKSRPTAVSGAKPGLVGTAAGPTSSRPPTPGTPSTTTRATGNPARSSVRP